MTTPILLDCDPGHDDAIALLLALASPEVDLLGITTVAGNQTLEKTTANALKCSSSSAAPRCPSRAAPTRPLVREPLRRRLRPRRDGHGRPDLPRADTVAAEHAVDFLADEIRAPDGR